MELLIGLLEKALAAAPPRVAALVLAAVAAPTAFGYVLYWAFGLATLKRDVATLKATSLTKGNFDERFDALKDWLDEKLKPVEHLFLEPLREAMAARVVRSVTAAIDPDAEADAATLERAVKAARNVP